MNENKKINIVHTVLKFAKNNSDTKRRCNSKKNIVGIKNRFLNSSTHELFEACDPDACGSAWTRQTDEMARANVAGEQGRAHLQTTGGFGKRELWRQGARRVENKKLRKHRW